MCRRRIGRKGGANQRELLRLPSFPSFSSPLLLLFDPPRLPPDDLFFFLSFPGCTENFLPKVDGVTRTLARLLEHLHNEGHEALLCGPETGMVRLGFFLAFVSDLDRHRETDAETVLALFFSLTTLPILSLELSESLSSFTLG